MTLKVAWVVMKKWALDHKKTLAISGVVVVVVALCLGAYWLGRGNVRTVEKEVVKTQIHEHTVYKDRVVLQKVYVQVEKKQTHKEITTEKKPDGTVITRTTEDQNVDEDTRTDTNKTENKDVTRDKVVVQTVEKLKLVEKPINWRIGAGVGYSIPYGLGQNNIGLAGMNGWVVQAGIDRRVIGPMWLGVWGNTQGVAGLNLSFAW